MHWTPTLTSSYSKTFVFDRPHEYDKVPFLKIYSLESVFKNLRICGRKRRFTCEREVQMEEKNLRFGKNPDKSGRGLSAYIFYRRHKHIQANMQKSQRHHECLARSLKATKKRTNKHVKAWLISSTDHRKDHPSLIYRLQQRCFYSRRSQEFTTNTIWYL